MKILGIDPGLKGGLTILTTDERTRRRSVVAIAMPVTDHISGKGEMIHEEAITEWITTLFPGLKPFDCVVMELVAGNNTPGHIVSATSMFNFGMSYGILLSMFNPRKTGCPLLTPRPQVWQKVAFAHAPGKGETKARSRVVCKKLFPDLSLLRTARCTTEHDGISDSACLAYYGEQHMLGATASESVAAAKTKTTRKKKAAAVWNATEADETEMGVDRE